MLVHLFNSSSVSGPERLVLPSLQWAQNSIIVNLLEQRIEGLPETDPLREYARTLNLEYHAIPVKSRWDRQAISQLQQLLLKIKPTVVHAHCIKASVYLLQAKSMSEQFDFPIVSTHHGVHGTPDWKVWLYEIYYRRFVLKKFDRVLAVSSADYKFLLRSGLKAGHLRLHLNGINGKHVRVENRPDEAHQVRKSWFPQDSQEPKPFLFGVVARLSPEKDHDRLLKVLARLKQMPFDQDWKCLIFGSGELEPALRRQAESLGLGDRVLWMGYRKNIAEELAGLNLLLSFSKAEGLPINLIEAGWTGTPVMATRVGGVADLIPDQRYGHLVPPGEQVQSTALKLFHVLTEKGQSELKNQAICFQERVITKFSQKKWVSRLKEIYSEMGAVVDRPSAAVSQALRAMVLMLLVLVSKADLLRSEIPQPPVLLLTSKENGGQSQDNFSCSDPVYGYITLPQKTSGKHVMEGIWTGPKGTVIQHSQNELNFPAPGGRTAEIWLQFSKAGPAWDPLSLDDPKEADRSTYNGPWKVEVRWDGQRLVESKFQMLCLN